MFTVALLGYIQISMDFFYFPSFLACTLGTD